ncbi:MAG: AbrB/MazE/SpoVT family DNA-binding domain-containing protein, partial [Terriglobales bacterium]
PCRAKVIFCYNIGMHTTKLRRVGGSVMLAVPPALLRLLELEPGEAVRLDVQEGRLVAHPQRRPIYSLDQLLGEWKRQPKSNAADRAWLESAAAGRELL